MNTKTSRKNMKSQPKVKYVALNPMTRKFEQVFPESEIPANQMVIPMFWCQSTERFVTVPGTEVYGYVPSN